MGALQMRGSDMLRLVLKRTHVLFCQAGSFPSQRINATCQWSPTCCQASEWCVRGEGGQQIMSWNFRVLLAFLHFNFRGGGGSWLRIRPLGRWPLPSCKLRRLQADVSAAAAWCQLLLVKAKQGRKIGLSAVCCLGKKCVGKIEKQ